MQPKQNSLHMIILTHWHRNKITAISQTTIPNAFSWMKMFEFWLKFHHSCPTASPHLGPNTLTVEMIPPKKFINWLAPWRCHNNYKNIIFKVIIQRSYSSPPFEIAPIWMPQHLTNAKSALLQVMATRQYMSKCWSRLIVRRGGLIWSHEDPEMWWSVPLTCAWLYMSFLLFCLICVYSSQFSIFIWIMCLL